MQTKFRAAQAFFAVGDIKQAPSYHKDVFESRRRLSGPGHQETLASQYNLAVAYENEGDLEKAEHHLRENLKFSSLSMQWRKEDVARSKLRLAILLLGQARSGWALNLREALYAILGVDGVHGKPEIMGVGVDGLNRGLMGWFDLNVALWHGRTTGPWSDGEHW
ncbi:hypothetical protein B0T24DRAFT_618221 [Lasiosphaeria ovina]|uniref:Uncharacterized protein n=1 Tax=Lasiosphaeria ovina TaxID=92902 RepID=A0AAE0KGN9_9PEZI|nr:hypothetical protein B0T24DRAFT_618221 [Lasiosphaeria ovina]